MLYQATVTASSGSTVNLRDSYKSGSIIERVPIGSTVDVLEEINQDWAQIRTQKNTGFMMRQYLIKKCDPTPGGEYYVELQCSDADEAQRVLAALGRATIVGK